MSIVVLIDGSSVPLELVCLIGRGAEAFGAPLPGVSDALIRP